MSHSSQHALDTIEADALQLDDRFVQVLIVIQDQHDRCVERHQPAHPGTELVRQFNTK
jgi:hypothetical protein